MAGCWTTLKDDPLVLSFKPNTETFMLLKSQCPYEDFEANCEYEELMKYITNGTDIVKVKYSFLDSNNKFDWDLPLKDFITWD